MHNLKLAQSACIGLTLQRHQLSADGTTASIHPAPDHTDMSLYDLSAAEDVAGKVVLITGSSSGIGFATAVEMARRGAKVVVTSRSQQRASMAATEVAEKAGVDLLTAVSGMALKMDDMKTIKTFASNFCAKYPKLHCCVLNAGGFPKAGKTSDGFEQVFFERVLAQHALVSLLWKPLAAAGSAKSPSRVVTCCGPAATDVKHDAAAIEAWLREKAFGEMEGRELCVSPFKEPSPMGAMHEGLIAIASWSRHLGAKAGPKAKVLFLVSHPGMVDDTNFMKGVVPDFMRPCIRFLVRQFGAHSTPQACLSNVAACVMPGLAQGIYVGPKMKMSGMPRPIELDDAAGADAKVWKAIAGAAALKTGEMVVKEATRKTGCAISI